jgi:hypothetical protein
MGVNSEEESTEEQFVSDSSFESTESNVPNEVEEQEEEEAPAPRARVRRSFGESIVGRFKGFFENDEAMN